MGYGTGDVRLPAILHVKALFAHWFFQHAVVRYGAFDACGRVCLIQPGPYSVAPFCSAAPPVVAGADNGPDQFGRSGVLYFSESHATAGPVRYPGLCRTYFAVLGCVAVAERTHDGPGVVHLYSDLGCRWV